MMKVLDTMAKLGKLADKLMDEKVRNEAIKDVTISELDRLQEHLFNQYTVYEKAKAKAADEYKVFKAIEEKLTDELEQAGRERYQSPAGTFWFKYESGFKVPKDAQSRERFFTFLKEKGVFDQMITVNSKTLNSWAKKEEEIAQDSGELDFEIPGIEKTPPIKKGYRRRSK